MALVGTRLLSQLPEGAEEDDEHESKEKVLHRYFLQEWKIVKSLLDDIFSARRVTDLSAVARIRSIMDKYQEQGQLVEPYLESIVAPLMAIVRSRSIDFGSTSNEILEVIKPICIIIYSLVTVCGYKSVIKFFPHQVSDLELAVSLLDKCHCTNAATSLRQESTGEMETKCVILLWLSILVLIPFDISSVDTTMANCKDDGKDEPPPLVMKILEHCKDYLSNAGPMRSIAGLLLARLLTRSDMSKAFDRFIVWADQILSTTNENIIDHFRLLGVVEALAAIFKVHLDLSGKNPIPKLVAQFYIISYLDTSGSRSLLLNVAPIIWNRSTVLIKCTTATRSSLLRKYLVKLTQRIGLICLPHHSATWRYMGRNNTLGLTQECNWLSHSVNMKSDAYQDMCCLDEDVTDVPDIIEDIIELLLSGLRDTDTVVRWSAAKGIGRVTSRLSYSLSDEVLSSVLELFSACEGDGSWHGGCLALAELARRGLLLPISFPKVVPLIIKALHYDIRRGPHSIGSHVRDAAAYVCWAFGRVYYHGDMKNVLEELAPHLLTVACYDREVNCRRAAAAAFQENVGRQGNFPHGIDIVNLADYFALSSRVKSYLHVAVCIAQYDCYLHHFVYELIQSKICHWDKSLRELSASALSSLVQFDKEHFANVILENLAPCTLSSDLCMRHGATLSIAEVILALRKQNYSLSPDKQRVAAGIVPGIEKARLYRGKSGEIMRSAVCRFIECISMSQVSLTEKTKRNLLDSLDENLKHPNPLIQNAAIEALRHYITAYIPLGGKDGVIVSRYLEQLTDPNVAARRGSALALGVLPCDFLEKVWKSVLSKLCCSCQIEGDPNDRDPQSRVNAVKALVSVCETLTIPRESSAFFSGEDALELFLFIRDEVMSSLFKALDDYSTDNRGDVGSWVREAAMDGLERCTYILCKRDTIKQEKCWALEPEKSESYNSDKNNSSFNVDLAHKLVGGLVKQAVEKMDKLRESAAQILQRILYNKTVFVAHIPERETLESLIPDKVDLKWGVPTFSFPCFVQLLQVSSYSKYVASGLVISIGGLQESLRKASLSSLLEYLEITEAEGCNDSKVYNLSMDMLWILENSKKCDRVIIPTLKTIEILFSRGLLLHIEDHTPAFCASVLDSLALELKGTKDFSKLYSGIAILGYIASLSDPISIMAFSNLLTFLGHRYPKIRKSAAEQVYLVLLGNGNLMADDKLDEATDIIAETCWEGDIKEAKKRRLQLCQMANIRPAQTATASEVESKKIVQQKMISADENASYSSLVGSAGF